MPLPANTTQVVAVWFAGGALVVSVLAIVIAFLSWRTARWNVAIAVREEQRRDADRHAADGPTFKLKDGRIGQHDGRVMVTVVGGPGRVALTAHIEDAPWCAGFARGDDTFDMTAQLGELEPGETFTRHVGLKRDRDQSVMEPVLPLRIVAVSNEQPARTWELRVKLTPGPERPVIF